MKKSLKDLKELEEWAQLARNLIEANDKRNRFIEQFVDFDTFAEVWQYVGDNRKQYDELERKANDAHRKFKVEVMDKKAVMERLQNIGENETAERIYKIFKVNIKNESRLKKK